MVPQLTLAELEPFMDFLREVLRENPTMGYRPLRSKLTKEKGVTASDGTMRRLLTHLKKPEDAPQQPKPEEPAPTLLTREELAPHMDFLLEELRKNPTMGYRVPFTALAKERGVTAAVGTMQRVHQELKAQLESQTQTQEELAPYMDWLREELA